MFERLIQQHVKRGYLRNPDLVSVMVQYPLEKVFTTEQINDLLHDRPTVFYEDKVQMRTLSAPHMISICLSMLELTGRDKVLVLGAKGGFLEAIVASIAKSVTIVEEYEPICKATKETLDTLGIDNANVVNGNPTIGYESGAPFSKVIITGAVKAVPDAIFGQLKRYGIVIAPIEVRKDLQQMVQFVNAPSGIEANNYGGGVIFSPLYYKTEKSKGRELKTLKTKQKSFEQEMEDLPAVVVKDVFFKDMGKAMSLDLDNPSYVMMVQLCNNTGSKTVVQLKLEMPSLDKDVTQGKFQISPNKEQVESLIVANAKKEGVHDFKVIVQDPDGLRINYIQGEVEIKKPLLKKVLEFTLRVIGGAAGQAIGGAIGGKITSMLK